MSRYALAAVVEASDAETAHRYVAEALVAGRRWERPLAVAYVGDGCEIGSAECYSTEELHLLCDGMRSIATPDRDRH